MTNVKNAPESRGTKLSLAEADAVYMMLGNRIMTLTQDLFVALSLSQQSNAQQILIQLETTQRIQNKMIENLHLFPK